MSASNRWHRIFGIGLSRTGTTSLAAALEVLGIKTIHYPHDEQTEAELTHGHWRLSVLRHHQAVTDISVAPFYVELDRAFPGSLFILTVRDEFSWLRSVEAHMHLLAKQHALGSQFQRFTDFICRATYGSSVFEPRAFRYAYRTHVAAVLDYFRDRPRNLLSLDICAGEGWEKLAPFLGVPTPSVPFPNANSAGARDDWWARLDRLRQNLRSVLTSDQWVTLVDDNQLGVDFLGSRKLRLFGADAEHFSTRPVDDRAAVEELERQLRAGARFLVIAWPAFWWLEHYREFFTLLNMRYSHSEIDDAIVYELRARSASKPLLLKTK